MDNRDSGIREVERVSLSEVEGYVRYAPDPEVVFRVMVAIATLVFLVSEFAQLCGTR